MADAKLHDWQVTTDGVCVEGQQNGYTRLASPVIHRRRIEYHGSLQWVITDILENEGQANYQYDWWFHLAPANCIIDAEAQSCLARFASGKCLSIAMQQLVGAKINIERCWLSGTWKEKRVAPVVRLSYMSAESKVQLTTLLSVTL